MKHIATDTFVDEVNRAANQIVYQDKWIEDPLLRAAAMILLDGPVNVAENYEASNGRDKFSLYVSAR